MLVIDCDCVRGESARDLAVRADRPYDADAPAAVSVPVDRVQVLNNTTSPHHATCPTFRLAEHKLGVATPTNSLWAAGMPCIPLVQSKCVCFSAHNQLCQRYPPLVGFVAIRQL